MSDTIIVALIMAASQILQGLLHRRHERVTRDTNKKLTVYLNGETPHGPPER